MSTPLYILCALTGVIVCCALLISLVAMIIARASAAALAVHEAQCRKTDGEIYERLHASVKSQNRINEDILRTLGNIEGYLAADANARAHNHGSLRRHNFPAQIPPTGSPP